MGQMISVREAAERWGITERRVTVLCKEGRIEGACKSGRRWEIPSDAKKPGDSRVKTGAYKKSKMKLGLPLPIGISDYRLASSEYYYVDKTMMIKEFLDERPRVSLFTRPSRFGKTLNMDMLRTFFEKTRDDTSVYFRDKKIWACGEKYRSFQGKYPVISLTFKDAKRDTWPETYAHLSRILRGEFERHSGLLDSDRCGKYEKACYGRILQGEADSTDLMFSLQTLSQMLDQHYGIPPIIFIDGYDTPIQQGYRMGFYGEVILFLRNLLSAGLRDNRHLSYGFLTGILCAAEEGTLSELNNWKINSLLDNKYSEYFGFTPDEVKEMAGYYGAGDKYDEICAWYRGYRFGNSEIFNPWSVVNYLGNECQPGVFWPSAGNNEIVGEILADGGAGIYGRLNDLLQGKSFLSFIDPGVIYPQVSTNPSSVYSFLLVEGYLKAVKAESSFNGGFMCQVALPNREIVFACRKEILRRLDVMIPQGAVISIQEALYSRDVEELQMQIRKLLFQSVGSYEEFGEGFYPRLALGFCAMMGSYYHIDMSVGPAGEGGQIQLLSNSGDLPGIFIVLKAVKNSFPERLKQLAEAALKQIDDCEAHVKTDGNHTVMYKYGVAFSGKQAGIAVSSV